MKTIYLLDEKFQRKKKIEFSYVNGVIQVPKDL